MESGHRSIISTFHGHELIYHDIEQKNVYKKMASRIYGRNQRPIKQPNFPESVFTPSISSPEKYLDLSSRKYLKILWAKEIIKIYN